MPIHQPLSHWNFALARNKVYLTLDPLLEQLSESEVTQSCPTLCNPVDCSLPSFSVHGILQARILEWVAISF